MMTPEEKAEVEALIIETMERELPKMLGRSLVQIKEYLIKNIT